MSERGFHRLLYHNPLAAPRDIDGFRLEGQAQITFPAGRLRMENAVSAQYGQKSNYVLWCPVQFPDTILVKWNFQPLKEPGLCMLFFAATGRRGKDLFDASLQKRTGEYPLYHHGDINTFHVSYFRRLLPDERAFHTCNLRKSYGFHLVAQGGDPIPSVKDCVGPYRMTLRKVGAEIAFFINDLLVFDWVDDGTRFGPLLGGGKLGFRQLAPLVAEHSDLDVYTV